MSNKEKSKACLAEVRTTLNDSNILQNISHFLTKRVYFGLFLFLAAPRCHHYLIYGNTTLKSI